MTGKSAKNVIKAGQKRNKKGDMGLILGLD